jgi:hypothetical protein
MQHQAPSVRHEITDSSDIKPRTSAQATQQGPAVESLPLAVAHESLHHTGFEQYYSLSLDNVSRPERCMVIRDWEKLRSQIVDLYVGQHRSLDEVVRIVNTSNGLDIS